MSRNHKDRRSAQKAKGVVTICLGIFAILLGGMCSSSALIGTSEDPFDQSMAQTSLILSLIPFGVGFYWLWLGWRALKNK